MKIELHRHLTISKNRRPTIVHTNDERLSPLILATKVPFNATTQVSRHRRLLLMIFYVLVVYATYHAFTVYHNLVPPVRINCKKWIVIVSEEPDINELKEVASNNPDWTVLVVSDTRRETHLPENVRFLTIRDEEYVYFGGAPKLMRSFAEQKNIGYLTAIYNGAEWVHDGWPPVKKGRLSDIYIFSHNSSGIRFQPPDGRGSEDTYLFFNPYDFYGRPDLMPVWYPRKVRNETSSSAEYFRLCRWNAKPSVQYALITDNFERTETLPQQHENTDSFNKYAPRVILAPDTYTIWSGEPALYHSSAFFALFLPVTVPIRISLAIRSLIVQKMLQLTGEVASMNPLDHTRNHHMIEDSRTSKMTGSTIAAMIRQISEYKCKNTGTAECLREIIGKIMAIGILREQDRASLDLWIGGLHRTLYDFPRLKEADNSYELMNDTVRLRNNCRRMNLALENSSPEDQDRKALNKSKAKIEHWRELTQWCAVGTNTTIDFDNLPFPSPEKVQKLHQQMKHMNMNLENVALIITNNWPWKFGIGHLQRMYMDFFSVTIFCGTYDEDIVDRDMDDHFLPPIKPFNYVRLSTEEMFEGYTGFYCLSKVAELNLRNIKGYLMFSDDVIFNQWWPNNNYDTANAQGYQRRNDILWNRETGLKAILEAYDLITVKYKNDTDVQNTMKTYQAGLLANGYPRSINYFFNDTDWRKQFVNPDGYSISDFVYVPSSNITYFSQLMEIMFEARVYHEIAFSKFQLTVPTTYHPDLIYIWRQTRNNWERYYNAKIGMLHSVKLSRIATESGQKTKYCEKVIYTQYKMLFEKAIR